MLRRKPSDEPEERPVDDRAWSARTNMHARDVGEDVVHYSPQPACLGRPLDVAD